MNTYHDDIPTLNGVPQTPYQIIHVILLINNAVILEKGRERELGNQKKQRVR